MQRCTLPTTTTVITAPLARRPPFSFGFLPPCAFGGGRLGLNTAAQPVASGPPHLLARSGHWTRLLLLLLHPTQTTPGARRFLCLVFLFSLVQSLSLPAANYRLILLFSLSVLFFGQAFTSPIFLRLISIFFLPFLSLDSLPPTSNRHRLLRFSHPPPSSRLSIARRLPFLSDTL